MAHSHVGHVVEGCTLGFGVGPGEARPVLVMPQDPFLLADGGVLQKAPAPAAVLCFRAVWNRPEGRPRPEREDASETKLSSASSLDCADAAGLHSRNASVDAAPTLSKKSNVKHVLKSKRGVAKVPNLCVEDYTALMLLVRVGACSTMSGLIEACGNK